MITMEDIIIKRGDIEKVYKSNITLTLWRALRNDDPKSNPLYPDLSSKILPNGIIREADVSTFIEKKSGIRYVKSEEGRGTSVVDKDGIFGHKNWDYVVIPKGTPIPKEVIITKDHLMPRKKCWHYSISPNFDMPVSHFLSALDQLALRAGIRLRGRKNA